VNLQTYNVAIIGGGAAGMMAAIAASENGKKVVVIEKNKQLGKKLLITGKGRCNITNYCDVKELIANCPRNGRFMTNAFYHFNSFQTIDFFHNLGLQTKIERGNRVFPQSDKASDVVKVLQLKLTELKVDIINQPAKKLVKTAKVFAVQLQNGQNIRAEKLIIATGGKSYPATGSTGDGYKFAKSFGHKLTRFQPSLVPLEAKYFIDTNQKNIPQLNVNQLQGLSLKNVAIEVWHENTKLYEDFGEMLFTHFGVSGPIILSASSHLRQINSHLLKIDLKPALDEAKLDKRLVREFEQNSNKQLQNILKNLLPKKMIPVFLQLVAINPEIPANRITKAQRKQIGWQLKNLWLKLEKFRPIHEAIITSGGVEVSQIDPQTMESKLVPGLYFAGEVLDVDAYTGGFNLQIAWSSGFVAGNSV
jgi:hypothetical protein